MRHAFFQSTRINDITMKASVLFVLVGWLSFVHAVAQETFTTSNASISFYSEAPVSDVDARNNKAKVSLNTSSSELLVNVVMDEFQFKNEKMGRDARRSYIEIDKYPKAGFRGKISGKINYDKPGTYEAVAKGKLNVHGVEKEVTQKGTVTVGDDKIILKSQFYVELNDFQIETPKILGKEMTQEKVLVKIEASLSPQVDAASKK